jgi:hypothetical protein
MMWIREPQKVSEEIEYLGTADMCVYLLKGREYMEIFRGVIKSIVDNIVDSEISGQVG